MHFLLFSNINKDPEQKVTDHLAEIIRKKGGTCSIVMEGDEAPDRTLDEELLKGTDLVIVLGGDGTLLRASHAVGRSELPMIGLNLGTTGFLTEVEIAQQEEMVDRLIRGDYMVEPRMRLTGVIRRAPAGNAVSDNSSVPAAPGSAEEQRISTEERFTSLNDIVIIREGVLRLIALKIYVNDVFFDTYEADGVILSTPTGSTGYNLSAGGPIVSPKARLLVMTPVSPHSLSKKSIVFGAGDKIRIELEEKRKTQKNEAIVSFDGYKNYEISVGDEVEICASDSALQLIRLEDRSFYEVLSRKLGPK